MPVSTVNTTSPNPRVEALRAKHLRLSEKIEKERQKPSANDFDIVQMKKEKLLIKEKIAIEEGQLRLATA